MKNRGQVTAFVILGFVILILVLLMMYIFSSALRKEEPLKETVIASDISDVKEYITSCIEDSLKNAVSHCSGNFPGGRPKCPDYETDIADRTKEEFCDCIPNCNDFSSFKNLQVEIKGEMNLKADLTEDKKKIILTMEYPLLIKKDGSENMLGMTEYPFTAQYSLEQTDCVPIKLVDNDHQRCESAEPKTVEILGFILTYNTGDKVVMGENCIAC